MNTQQYKIPDAINVVITIMCSAAYFVLLWLASHTNSNWMVLLYGLWFAVTMVPVYSLIHEAEHNIINSNQTVNDIMGRWLSTLFIAPYTFFKHCHLKHHKKNRTDEEMWDLYYEHQDKQKRFGTLYGMMIGIGYFSIVLAVILFAIEPRLIYSRFFSSHKETGGFLKGSDRKDKLQRSRRESWLVIIFQVSLFFLLDLHWAAWLTLLVMHGFLWSSQNYVNHAFSPRDIINGAHNLKMPLWLKPVYLNFNLHLAHHQNPQVPWLHLPKFIRSDKGRIQFFKNYLRLWKGPRVTQEAAPRSSTHEGDED